MGDKKERIILRNCAENNENIKQMSKIDLTIPFDVVNGEAKTFCTTLKNAIRDIRKKQTHKDEPMMRDP